MSKGTDYLLVAALGVSLLLPVRIAQAWDEVVGPAEFHCTQADESELQCDHHLVRIGPEPAINLLVGKREITPSSRERFPWSGAISAVLILVDTSDPGREAVVRKNASQILALVRAGKSYHRFGLAAFDHELRMLAPLGASPGSIDTALAGLNATGLTTELYRSVLEAIRVLGRYQAQRRSIIVFSDGQAEDRAYFHQDVIRAARNAGVGIYTVGFPRTTSLSVALQTLRRLADETGGKYMEADAGFELPAGYAQSILSLADSGGRLRFVLDQAAQLAGTATLSVASPDGIDEARIPLQRPVTEPLQSRPLPAGPAAAPPQAQPQVKVITTPSTPQPRSDLDEWLWYGIPIALLVLIVLTITTLILLTRKPRGSAGTTTIIKTDQKPLAYLITQDENAVRYPILGPIWRIGRSRENELQLDDASVSRRHAEIQRQPDGSFTLADRESLNGVFVNTRKIGKQTLKEGDILEIGDIVMRFSEMPADDALQEQTAIQHTRQPRIA